MFLRNAGCVLKDYTALCPRKYNCLILVPALQLNSFIIMAYIVSSLTLFITVFHEKIFSHFVYIFAC
jgi:hypothetical protein